MESHNRQMALYNRGRILNPFKIRDPVLRKTHILSDDDRAVCGSLTPKYEGPYKLVDQICENTYSLEDMNGIPAGRRNSDQLRLLALPPTWSNFNPIYDNNNTTVEIIEIDDLRNVNKLSFSLSRSD
jgi:hypothetical protein